MAQRDGPRTDGPPEDLHLPVPVRNYRRLFAYVVVSIGLVAVIPLLIMTGVNYYQYRDALQTEVTRPLNYLTATSKRSVEFYLSQRQSALTLVVREEPLDVLRDPTLLNRLLINLKRSFGGFVDLGIIDNRGVQIAYAGPYRLLGKSYSEQDWYHQVLRRGAATSEVFRGHRNEPHFVIAVQHHTDRDGSYILRATFDVDTLTEQLSGVGVRPSSDAFIVSRDGVLQTPSRWYGSVLERCPLKVPVYPQQGLLTNMRDDAGRSFTVGYALVSHSPFVLMILNQDKELTESWASLRRDLLLFLVISVAVILAVVVWGSRGMIHRIRESDLKRSAISHKMEFTNKMAAIGRLASGVAHEVNNPLAIINEKAGLAKDLLTYSDQMPPKEKLLKLIDAVLYSVERCSVITHRLLGFAKHMDVKHEPIDVVALLKQVYGFLEKEASYRDLKVSFEARHGLPTLESDRGQLQQVFLNLLNNAFAAVADGGEIEVSVASVEEDSLIVTIRDNGMGIPEKDLEHIFEPFFTTKKGTGTGLGLSITYGIVDKLGGTIDVWSKVGEGTAVTVILPLVRDVG